MVVTVSCPNGDPRAQHFSQSGASTLTGAPPYTILPPHNGFSYGSVGFHIMVPM